MDICSTIKYLDQKIQDPTKGLPEDVFYFISRNTPLVNVDLLVKDQKGRTLLAWRDDPYAGVGWHIPGGIVRFKETLEDRIQKVAESELGTKVKFDKKPIAVNEIIIPEYTNRGHFISFLYSCKLQKEINTKELVVGTYIGELTWFASCPENIVRVHEIYRKYI